MPVYQLKLQSTLLCCFPCVSRQRLEKKLNFDNYKEKLCMLLHVEELQMQKDIRNYDMKGVEFKQERLDRRFLILEVSINRFQLCIEGNEKNAIEKRG